MIDNPMPYMALKITELFLLKMILHCNGQQKNQIIC